jgi:hypothetical protein
MLVLAGICGPRGSITDAQSTVLKCWELTLILSYAADNLIGHRRMPRKVLTCEFRDNGASLFLPALAHLRGFVRSNPASGARARGFTLRPGRRLNKDRFNTRSRLFEAKSPSR